MPGSSNDPIPKKEYDQNLVLLTEEDILRSEYRELGTETPTALCLSGGGIRSAAFCLGALQGFADAGSLKQFNYLSTVSGGGYIGSWLQALITNTTLNDAIDALKTQPGTRDPALGNPVLALRNFTNFLTPAGNVSMDSFAGAILWFRNTFLNWLIFTPIFAAIALTPEIYRLTIEAAASTRPGLECILVFALAFLLIATVDGCRFLPTQAFARQRQAPPGQPQGRTVGEIDEGITWPMVAWTILLPVWAATEIANDGAAAGWRYGFPIAVGAVLILGFVFAGVSANAYTRPFYRRNFPYWFLASLITTAFLSAGVLYCDEAGRYISGKIGDSIRAEYGVSCANCGAILLLVIFGPLWITLADLLQTTVYVGFRNFARFGNIDREWLARLNARLLILPVIWMLLSATTLIVPLIVAMKARAIVAALTGPVGAMIARSTGTLAGNTPADITKAASGKSNATNRLLFTVAAIFGVSLFALLAEATRRAIARIIAPIAPSLMAAEFTVDRLMIALAIMALMASLAWFAGKYINVNRFSMHDVYRMRLARAFIGTTLSEAKVRPDRFTSFDPQVGIAMTSLWSMFRCVEPCLFPVINVALNLVGTDNPALKERKAKPFTITPLHSGSAALRHLDAKRSTPQKPVYNRGTYVDTCAYARRDPRSDTPGTGIKLSTAMTISGAAVSPNMGYHSSPIAGMLMTLFNARLGIWLPNPAGPGMTPRDMQRNGPNNAVGALAREISGRTTDDRTEIYLSDGGHFDNLGLYEMLRRRCRRIIVIDAGADPKYAFADLGTAIRLASIDGLAEVNFVTRLTAGIGEMPVHGAYATIQYPPGKDGNAPIGELIYFKSHMITPLPVALVAHAAASKDFPHDNTADQFFTESQFESYRQLGHEIIKRAMDGGKTIGTLLTFSRTAAG